MVKGRELQESTDRAVEANRHQFYSDDEIDLKELIIALWQGKVTIMAVTVLCAAIAVVYALKAEEVWTAKASVSAPEVSDFVDYQTMVSNYQPVFDVYQESGAILVSEKLDNLLSPESLLKTFIQQYGVTANKREYLASSAEFRGELAALGNQYPESSIEYQDAAARLYSEWYGKLNLEASKPDDGSYSLQGIQDTADKSLEFLQGYITYIDQKSRNLLLANLNAMLDSKESELYQQKTMLSAQAAGRLSNERELAKYSLQIARAAGVNTPQQNLGDQELFAINIGANALQAKVNVLNGLDDNQLGIIEPRLQSINAKLNLLETMEIDKNVAFKTFQYVTEPEKPLSRTAPKRPLIAILGVLLGGMLGCGIVLVRFAFRKK